MAVIKLDLKDLRHLLGFEVSREDLMERLPLLGCDIEDYDREHLYVEFFPNRPDLYSVEGVARALRAFYGRERGLKHYRLLPPRTHMEVDERLGGIRPYVVACEVEGVELGHEGIQALMDLQEDIHWVLGRDRRKVSIGLHDPKDVVPPYSYRALKDHEVKFVPLEMEEELSPKEVLEKHPKGQKYSHIITGHGLYPFIMDSRGQVLSLPPIINGQLTRVGEGTRSFFVDITGTDSGLITRALNILATAFLERGFRVYQVEVRYGGQRLITPDFTPEEREIRLDYINSLLGVELGSGEAVEALERMGYSSEHGQGKLKIKIPPYRSDIMHDVDIVEDVAIGYGYENLEPRLPQIATTGEEHPLERKWSKLRKLLTGYGLSEVMSLMLSNERESFEHMQLEEDGVRIRNPISEEHTLVRGSLLPGLLNVLRINRRHDLPQKIFEIGDVVRPDPSREQKARRERKLGIAMIHSRASFTEIKSLVEALLRDYGREHHMEPSARGSFIPGRCASIVSRGKEVGYLGEIHPRVLTSFELEYPVVALELDLERL